MSWAAIARDRSRELFAVIRGRPLLYRSVVILLAIDLGFILWWSATRLLYNLDVTQDLYEIDPLRIDKEGGIPEWIGYVETLVLVLLLARLTLIRRRWIYASFTLLFAVMLADDKLTVHELGGRYFARTLGLPAMWGMRPVDLGEVITWAILGALLLPPLLLGLVCAKGQDLANGLALLVPVGALVFFGMIVDQIYHMGRDLFFGADIVLGALEDGGEMVAITVALAFGAAMSETRPSVRGPTHVQDCTRAPG